MKHAHALGSVANVLASRTCVPLAALISPTTLFCRNDGSRDPRTCSQSTAQASCAFRRRSSWSRWYMAETKGWQPTERQQAEAAPRLGLRLRRYHEPRPEARLPGDVFPKEMLNGRPPRTWAERDDRDLVLEW